MSNMYAIIVTNPDKTEELCCLDGEGQVLSEDKKFVERVMEFLSVGFQENSYRIIPFIDREVY